MPAINAKFRTVAMFVTYLTNVIRSIKILIQNIGPVGHQLSSSYEGGGEGGGEAWPQFVFYIQQKICINKKPHSSLQSLHVAIKLFHDLKLSGSASDLTDRYRNETISVMFIFKTHHGHTQIIIIIIIIITIIIITTIILVIISMQDIYNYIPETNRVSRVYSVETVLLLTLWRRNFL